jgi:hypothetical protein
MSLNPDVVFTTQSADNADTLQQQLSVPVVCVLSLPEADYELFRLVGKVIGKTARARYAHPITSRALQSIGFTCFDVLQMRELSFQILRLFCVDRIDLFRFESFEHSYNLGSACVA